MLVPSSEATEKRVSLMDRLRTETHRQHKDAESRPLERALAAGKVSRALYADYLVQRLLVHQKLEALMRALLHDDGRLRRCVTDDLFQEANLRCDLQALGRPASPADLRPPAAGMLSLFDRVMSETPVALLGAWYVFEGSKNGARFIARAVAATLNLQPGPGLTYLDPHGPAQRERWLTFRAAVDAEDWTSTEADAIVVAAQSTFAGISAVDDDIWATHTA
jgi:heme oxygenase (biliverdin-IX-beta and delta-forming)